jgi:hypothetical protein
MEVGLPVRTPFYFDGRDALLYGLFGWAECEVLGRFRCVVVVLLWRGSEERE